MAEKKTVAWVQKTASGIKERLRAYSIITGNVGGTFWKEFQAHVKDCVATFNEEFEEDPARQVTLDITLGRLFVFPKRFVNSGQRAEPQLRVSFHPVERIISYEIQPPQYRKHGGVVPVDVGEKQSVVALDDDGQVISLESVVRKVLEPFLETIGLGTAQFKSEP